MGNYSKRITGSKREVPAPVRETMGNALMSALDFIQRPQYAVTNPLVLETKPENQKPLFPSQK